MMVPGWCGFGAVRAVWCCHHQLDAPASAGELGSTGRMLLGMNCCSSGIGTKSKLEHPSLEHRILVLPFWLQVFGQEHMCRARHVSACAAWLFLSCKDFLVFFSVLTMPQSTGLGTQSASGTHLLGKRWLWNVLLLLTEMWQCRAWKAALVNYPALCWRPASLMTHLSQSQ